MTMDLERLIREYEAGVQHPDASGMEHLNLLMVRSSMARAEAELTNAQRLRLEKADRILFAEADRLLQAIQHIADLESWRTQENATPEEWWWYLDVIASLPATIVQREKQALTA